MERSNIGIIGMGLLGSAIADRLLEAGWHVRGFDLSADRRAAMHERGVEVAESTAAVARSSSRLLLSLPTSSIAGHVLAELTAELQPGDYVIDTTTGKPSEMTAYAARLAERGVGYLDAAVAGSSAQVRARQAAVLVGGEPATFEACREVFAVFATEAFHVGPAGSGAKFKLVHNLMLGLHRAVLGEALAFAEALQLDLSTVLKVLKQTPACSAVMDSKGRKMIEGDFAPQATVSQHLKDVRLILSEAAETGLDLPLSRLHESLLMSVEATGLGSCDNSAIITAFRGRGQERTIEE